MKNKPLIVGIGGTTRAGSSSEKLVRCVLREIETQGGETKMFGGEALAELPHFTPENSQRSAEQQQFIESIRQADGLVI
jgi:FMN reductase